MNASEQQNKRHAQIAADLRDMTLLYEVALRCVREGSEFHECLKAIVDAAIALTAADKGNIQLIDPPSRALVIAVQRGFDPPFLKFFERVSDGSSACGAAMERGKHVLVEDVQQSAVFAGKPSLEVMLQAGVRAVLSVPLVSSRGTVFGMISTHFKKPHRCDERELRLVDLLAKQTAEYVARCLSEKLFLLSSLAAEKLEGLSLVANLETRLANESENS
jgi:GAF domain-containing protein